jgi:FXSXX-COOH protein
MDSNTGGEDEQELGLVDITRMPLAELLPSDDTVLTNALRRLLVELDRPQENFAAFGNVAQ